MVSQTYSLAERTAEITSDSVDIHPEVQRFVDNIDTIETPREFQYFTSSHRVWGTAPGNGGTMDVGLKLFFGSILLGFFGGRGAAGPIVLAISGLLFSISLVMMCIGVFQPLQGSDAVVTFQIDFSGPTPKWSCNDEKFWKNVRKFFSV